MSQRWHEPRVLTVGRDAVGLPWRRVGSVRSSLLDPCAVLSLSICCHCWEGWDCHYVGIMPVQKGKRWSKAAVTAQDLLEHSWNTADTSQTVRI